jgi:hypothetical protein
MQAPRIGQMPGENRDQTPLVEAYQQFLHEKELKSYNEHFKRNPITFRLLSAVLALQHHLERMLRLPHML